MTRTYFRIAVQIMAVDGRPLTEEHKIQSVERSGRLKFRLPTGQSGDSRPSCICGLVARAGTVAERYQGGVAHRSAEAAASWWHLLSDAAVSAAKAAAGSGAKRSRSVRAVHAALLRAEALSRPGRCRSNWSREQRAADRDAMSLIA